MRKMAGTLAALTLFGAVALASSAQASVHRTRLDDEHRQHHARVSTRASSSGLSPATAARPLAASTISSSSFASAAAS